MSKKVISIIALFLIICLAFTGCALVAPKLEFDDLTLEYGEVYDLPTELSGVLGASAVEYSFDGKNISIQDGKLKALVAETVTEVTAECGGAKATFKVTVVLSTKVDGGESPDGGNDGNGSDGGDVVDHGTMTVAAPKAIYSNYAGKEIKVTFSKPEYASDVTFTTDNAGVTVKDGKISAVGKFNGTVAVKVTAKSAYHEQTVTVNVSNYDGGIGVENTVAYYEQNIIKPENKGGIIFVGDSYFSGQLKDGKPSFWSDFYEDYADEKAFLLGISRSQIEQLEIASERIVYPMEPKEIVVHIGFNDVHSGLLSVEDIYSRIIALMEEYHEKLPEAKIYFIGVEPKKNGYNQNSEFYISSTVKAPRLTEMISSYANGKTWFNYVDTMSVFVSGNVIKQGSYLSTDLSHPTLEAYDEIREILNSARAADSAPPVPDDGDTPSVDPDTPSGGGTQKPDEPTGPIDYGTMTVKGPSAIYSNYPGKAIDVTFSKPEYASELTFTTNNVNVKVTDGKIAATGVFEEAFDVTVTVSCEHFATQTFTVSVSTYNGGVSAESKVQYYEKNIIKEENKGGLIFVGDSYFDGVPNATGSPSFWADFYHDYQNEKAFLMGISSSQIDDLEVVSERIVYPMEPKEIVVHIGFNDVHHGSLSVDELYSRITALCEQYRERLPDVKVYFIGVEPKKGGYKDTDQYYNSSTVKAPALTAKIKEYANSKEWFTYVDTLPIFTDGQTVISDSYLHCDLSHPSLHAYDAIRAAINAARGVANFVPDDVVYVNEYGVGTTIDSTGKTYTAKNGSALTDNYIVSGKFTIADINRSNAHIQFRFSNKYRFLLWDSNSDGKFGVGYSANGVNKNDSTTGAVIYDANKTRFNMTWDIVVNNGMAHLYLNGRLMEVMQSPTLEYFRIGAAQMDVQFYGITLTVKSENEQLYNEKLAGYQGIGSVPEVPEPEEPEVDDPTTLTINSYGVTTDINGTGKTFTNASGGALTDNYVIKGKLTISRVNKANAHLQFRFHDRNRFILWDNSNDGIFGAGYIIKEVASVSDKTSGVTLYDANSGNLSLDWAVVVNGGKAYWFINGELEVTFDAPTLSYFNIGALNMDVKMTEIALTVKSENATAYSALLTEYGIS